MKKVLFLCTGNSCRSQIAEAFVRRDGGEQWEAFSAGLEPKPIHPLTFQVMREIGLDLAGQRSKSVSEYLGKQRFDVVVSVCGEADAACPAIFPNMGLHLSWPFEDPAAFAGSEAERVKKFREVRDQIEAKIKTWLAAGN